MKVAISSPDGKFDAPFSTRFARCETFSLAAKRQLARRAQCVML
jgi:predicted Fe-Mo cluster-binding NifX family protein